MAGIVCMKHSKNVLPFYPKENNNNIQWVCSEEMWKKPPQKTRKMEKCVVWNSVNTRHNHKFSNYSKIYIYIYIFPISGEAAITIQSHSKFTCGTSYSNNSNILKVPLCTHWFEHRGQQPSIYGCDLGDVERLAPVTARFLHALPQACVAGTVTQRAREVAAPAGRHCYRVHSLAARMDWRVWRVGGEGRLGECQAQTAPVFL